MRVKKGEGSVELNTSRLPYLVTLLDSTDR